MNLWCLKISTGMTVTIISGKPRLQILFCLNNSCSSKIIISHIFPSIQLFIFLFHREHHIKFFTANKVHSSALFVSRTSTLGSTNMRGTCNLFMLAKITSRVNWYKRSMQIFLLCLPLTSSNSSPIIQACTSSSLFY